MINAGSQSPGGGPYLVSNPFNLQGQQVEAPDIYAGGDTGLSALEAAQQGLKLDASQEQEVYNHINDSWSRNQSQLQQKLDSFESQLTLANSQTELAKAQGQGNTSAAAVAQYQATNSAFALDAQQRDYSYQYGQYLYQLAVLDPGSA